MGKFFCFLLLAIPYSSVGQNTIYQDNLDRHYRDGLELMDKEKYGAAQESFRKYLEVDNMELKHVEARLYSALCGLYLFHPDAEELLSQFISDYPEHANLDLAFFNLGEFYFRNKNFRKAIKYLEKADEYSLDQDQTEERAFKLGYSHFASKEFEESLVYFNQIKAREGAYYSAANYYAGYVEYRQQQFGKALLDLKNAERSPAYKAVIPYLIVNVLNRQKRYDELIRYAENEIDFGAGLKNKSEIYLLLAESYFQKQDYNRAANNFDKYKSGRAKPAEDVAYRMGFTYLMTGKDKPAIDYFKRVAAKLDSLGQYASYYLGQLYLKEGNPQFAASAFQSASQMSFEPRIKEASEFHFGKINYELGRYQLAISTLQSFVRNYSSSSHSAEANELLSQAFLNTNDYQLAIEHIEALSSMSSTVKKVYQEVTFKQGVDFFNQEKYSNAVEFFEKSLFHPVNSQFVIAANYWRAEAFSVGNRYDQAIKSYRAIYKVSGYQENDYYLKSQYGLGYAHFNTSQYRQSLDNFRVYVGDINNPPSRKFYADAVLRLADSYYALKQYDQSLRYYGEVANKSRQDPDYAFYQMGVIHGIQGNVGEALQQLSRVVEHHPKSLFVDDAKFEMAQINLESGKYEQAESGFSFLLETEPQSPYVAFSLLRRGLARSNLGNIEGTIDDYKTLLRDHPESKAASGALLGLQEALVKQNQSDEFDVYLSRYKELNPDDTALEGVEYESAKTQYFDQKYPEAIERFQGYISTYPGTVSAFEATFYIAESYYRLDELPNALKYYHQVIEENKTHRINRSINRVADLELNQENYDQALEYYRKLGRVAQNKKEEFNSLIGQMKSHYYQTRYDSVNSLAQEILDKGDLSSRIQNVALLYQGKAAYVQGKFDQATDDFLTILNTAKDEAGAEAQYLLARIFFQQGLYPQSLETLYDLNANFSSYSPWLNRSFLLIADNFVAMDELFQAQETLKSIIENASDSSTVGAAKDKLEKVVLMQEQVNFPAVDSLTQDGTEVIID